MIHHNLANINDPLQCIAYILHRVNEGLSYVNLDCTHYYMGCRDLLLFNGLDVYHKFL